MRRIVMTAEEVGETQELLAPLTARYESPEDVEFLNEADVIAHDLPVRLRRELRHFRLHEPAHALLVISGWPCDQKKLGPTPSDWRRPGPDNDTAAESMLLVLFASLLGEPIGWGTQQDGRIVHDILPIAGHENEQMGSGSEQNLVWHVEDAFHPYRGDYLGLLCLRNHDRVPTTFAAVSKVAISPEHQAVLSSPHFTIRPDESHLPKNRGLASNPPELEALLERSYRKMERINEQPEKIPVLFGDPGAPYVRLDPHFMGPVEDPQAQEALDEITRQFDAAIEDCVLEPGDYMFLDNYQAVHGRKAFRARYDGTDRWLKRVNILRDLRKAREARLTAASRVLY